MTDTLHRTPPRGTNVMPCCGRTPFEVPRTDRITTHGRVTCNPAFLQEEHDSTVRVGTIVTVLGLITILSLLGAIAVWVGHAAGLIR